ncbi:DNA-directed primase/polymerase protein-like [Paramacrobiotus metropolitanus]|uniref:DNA-directed primase/polymerase protein-like n=1 Tax=Paramacrobiotus metropolitanus TaxID=2943436 RepID=UPI0024460884|nr:DNA-directed primase/polymerase protein-like [Paramacrobiotus metropolitanus]XP_055338535.1 DNA-directed primase/polymerase protein-like [Paramacrobiotus metropolitanus]
MDSSKFYGASSSVPTSPLVQKIEKAWKATVASKKKTPPGNTQDDAFDPFPLTFPKQNASSSSAHRAWPFGIVAQKKNAARSRLAGADKSHRDLLAKSAVWGLFYQLQPALDYAKEKNAQEQHREWPVRCFSYEHEQLRDGKRRFLATTYYHCWHIYWRTPEEQRMLYEVIPAELPVKLYFDVEFPRTEQNKGKNGDAMVDCLESRVYRCLSHLYPEKFPLNNLNAENGAVEGKLPMLKLDASTDAKFSQHLIFPTVVFRDVNHAGLFVKYLCSNRADYDAAADLSYDELLVWKKDGSAQGSCVDTGVYNKNRNFRLFLSHKQGKNNPLLFQPTAAFQDISEREIFMESLICNVESNCDALEFPAHLQPEIVRNCPVTNNFISADGDARAPVSGPGSPFPEVDRFIESVITRDGLQSSIRQCRYHPDTHSIVYNIQGQYRYCQRIGRHHASNGIFFVAYLKEGIYYQKCFDPDCRHYRSPSYSLNVKLTFEESAGTVADSSAESSQSEKASGGSDNGVSLI